MNLTHEDVQEILRLLDASPFDELHLETDRFKLTLRRAGTEGWTQENNTLSKPRMVQDTPQGSPATAAPRANTPDIPAPSPTATRSATLASSDPAPTQTATTLPILTPIIGTFYRAPKPGAPPFVEVGSEVTPNTVVAIVETMKLMNCVYAGAHGTIIEICQEDGKFVEQSQVLMRLNPAPEPEQA